MPDLGEKEVEEMAADVTGKANTNVKSKIMRRRLLGDDLTDDYEKMPRKSEVFSTSSLTEKIQAGVGEKNKELVKHTDLMTQMVNVLAGIKSAIPVAPRVIRKD